MREEAEEPSVWPLPFPAAPPLGGMQGRAAAGKAAVDPETPVGVEATQNRTREKVPWLWGLPLTFCAHGQNQLIYSVQLLSHAQLFGLDILLFKKTFFFGKKSSMYFLTFQSPQTETCVQMYMHMPSFCTYFS